MDWLNFLKVMAMDEETAYNKYNLAAQLATTPELKEILEKLRDEEEFHKNFLLDEYEKLRKSLEA
jgi:rubrerythrin